MDSSVIRRRYTKGCDHRASIPTKIAATKEKDVDPSVAPNADHADKVLFTILLKK